jgi:flagellar motility protein MotE (MotC chaperone)
MKKLRPENLETIRSWSRTGRSNSWLMVLTGCLAFSLPGASFASEADSASAGSSEAPAAPVVLMPRDDYCANIADLAADARHVLQVKTLEDLQTQIGQKIVALEAKRAELEVVLKKRDEAIKEAQKGLVDIFSKMKPDVAAAQLELLDVNTSASILKQLNARVASTILNEMKAPVAAAITIKMAKPLDNTKADGGT